MPISKLQNVWKELTLVSAWIISVTSSFLIPLPYWANSAKTSSFYNQFFIFFATVIAGFLILYSLKNKVLKTWMNLAISFFVLLLISFFTYNYLREIKTLPYENNDLIIGNVRIENDPLTILENQMDFPIRREEILKYVQGESQRIWTTKSIDNNRLQLMISLLFCYTFSACFLITFCNLMILYREKYKTDNANL